MISEIRKCVTLIFTLFIFTNPVFSQQNEGQSDNATLQKGLQMLEKYFMKRSNWYVTNPEIGKNVKGLVHFVENEPVDSIISKLEKTSSDTSFMYVFRLPENVPDSLNVPGYYPENKVERDIEKIGISLQNEFQKKEISVPMNLLTNIEDKVKLLEPGEGIVLFTDSIYSFPDSLKLLDAIPDTLIQNDADFQRILHLDSIRNEYIKEKRLAYNDSLINAYRDSVITQYRQDKFEEEYDFRKMRFVDSVKVNNYQVLKNYNDLVVQSVNDSISYVISTLSEYADFIDTTRLKILNLTDEESEITLQNKNQRYTRVWLKNEQKDSLSVLVKSTDKNSIQMFIDDGVTFSRFKPKETKDFDFNNFKPKQPEFSEVKDKYKLLTPWTFSGDGNLGFTQTYLNNWKAGGNSSIAMLAVLTGEAIYKSHDGNIQWENTMEINNGWIRQAKETQKNSDKIEFISKFGYSAFKKWYYSAEIDIKTQLFNGYDYDDDELISGFMSPLTTILKLGMDYKPNDNFSLLLSPLSSKTVLVKDTAHIDQTTYGIDEDKKRLWKPGFNVDVSFKKKFLDNITYQTEYEMFINYLAPFKKFDVDWENTITMKLTDAINMTFRLYLLYDDDVTFDTGRVDTEGNAIYKPKWQVKELLTLGFAYSFDRKIYRTKRLD